MLHFFHRLFNYHCPDCDAKPRCIVCEELRSLLATEKFEKKQLLEAILSFHQVSISPKPEPEHKPSNLRPLVTAQTWRVRKELLEQEDAAKARAMEQQRKDAEVARKSIDELEKEVGLVSGE